MENFSKKVRWSLSSQTWQKQIQFFQEPLCLICSLAMRMDLDPSPVLMCTKLLPNDCHSPGWHFHSSHNGVKSQPPSTFPIHLTWYFHPVYNKYRILQYQGSQFSQSTGLQKY